MTLAMAEKETERALLKLTCRECTAHDDGKGSTCFSRTMFALPFHGHYTSIYTWRGCANLVREIRDAQHTADRTPAEVKADEADERAFLKEWDADDANGEEG